MLKIGKLDSDLLQKIVIDKIKYKRPEIKTRAGIGEDCAVIDFGQYECVISTDPITAAVNQIGRLAIHISCNDIASNGIAPMGITLAVMLPEGTTVEDVEIIMAQAGEAAEAIGVEIIGGHTEITNAVNQPVIVSTAFGRGVADASQSTHNMKPGDYILMTKTAGLEGTGIIASDFQDQLQSVLTEEELSHGVSLLNQVSVVKEGVIAGAAGTAGMHDVTEGGILGAVWEMCHIAELDAEIWTDKIPVDPVTQKIAKHFDINPLRLISSGCMLIMAPKEKKQKLMETLMAAGVEVTCIGKVCLQGEGSEISPPEADELYKVVK